MRNLLRKLGTRNFNPGTAASMFFLNATNPTTIKVTKKVMIDWGYKLQRIAYRFAKAHRRGAGADAASAADRRQARGASRRSSTSSTSRCRATCPSARRARCSTSRTARSCPVIRDPREARGRGRGGVLLPGLRLGAPVLAGRARDAGDALPRRRADGAAAGLSVLRLPADRGRQPRRGPAHHHRQPRAVPSRREHAQLPRHQDGDRVLRHVHGPAA